MALTRDQIEHLEYRLKLCGFMTNPWRNVSHSRRWLKKQMNKYMRIKNKRIDDDDVGYKQGRKPYSGYEY